MKTAELTGAQLDLWVAHAEGMPIYECGADSWPGNGAVHCEAFRRPIITVGLTGTVHVEHMGHSEPYTPSTRWAHGGPIIDAQDIYFEPSNFQRDGKVFAFIDDGHHITPGQFGPTRLIAAMRAYVASKYGEEVDDQAPAQEPGAQQGQSSAEKGGAK